MNDDKHVLYGLVLAMLFFCALGLAACPWRVTQEIIEATALPYWASVELRNLRAENEALKAKLSRTNQEVVR